MEQLTERTEHCSERTRQIDARIRENLEGHIYYGFQTKIAKEFGVSREWVRQRFNKITKPFYEHYQDEYCRECPMCGKKKGTVSKYWDFCSSECRRDFHHMEKYVFLICKNCGEVFEKRIKEILNASPRTTFAYCNRYCMGRHIYKHTLKVYKDAQV